MVIEDVQERFADVYGNLRVAEQSVREIWEYV